MVAGLQRLMLQTYLISSDPKTTNLISGFLTVWMEKTIPKLFEKAQINNL